VRWALWSAFSPSQVLVYLAILGALLLVAGRARLGRALCVLGGAGLLLIADVLARVIMAPQELPVGIIMSLGGAPFFLWVLRRAKGQNFW
jgi:ABC-type Fe3+-siderophore transport system permease subunit